MDLLSFKEAVEVKREPCWDSRILKDLWSQELHSLHNTGYL